VLASLRDALRSGDIWIEGAVKYKGFEARLLPVADPAMSNPSANLPLDPDVWLAEKRARLDSLLQMAEDLAQKGKLPDAEIREGRLSISPLKNATPAAAKILARQIFSALPRVRITDLLEEVDTWTGYTDSFGHLRTGHPPKNRRALFTALIADGLNLGLTRMADASQVASFWQLARLVDWHIRDDSYTQATNILNDAQSQVSISKVWGDGGTSSSDGQFFHAGGPARNVSGVNLHYGSEPGVKFYTHITDQFAAYATRAIIKTAPERFAYDATMETETCRIHKRALSWYLALIHHSFGSLLALI